MSLDPCLVPPWLSVNYRGSTGFGQDSILSLPGNVGSQDVKDVQVAGTGASRQVGRVGQWRCGSIQPGRPLAAA